MFGEVIKTLEATSCVHFGRSQTDNIDQILTIANSIHKYICILKRDLRQGQFDYINRLIALLMIKLTD
jgi:hypothetical protein